MLVFRFDPPVEVKDLVNDVITRSMASLYVTNAIEAAVSSLSNPTNLSCVSGAGDVPLLSVDRGNEGLEEADGADRCGGDSSVRSTDSSEKRCVVHTNAV